MKRMFCTLMTLATVFSLGLSAAAAGNFSSFSQGNPQVISSVSYASSAMGVSDGRYESLFQGILNGRFPFFGQGNDTDQDSSSDQGDSTDEESSSGQGTVTRNCTVPAQVSVEGEGTLKSRTMIVSWEKVENADYYILQRSTTGEFTGDGTEELEEYTVKETSQKFVIAGTTPYYYPAVQTYYFRVKAVCDNCESDWSEVVVSEGSKEKIIPF